MFRQTRRRCSLETGAELGARIGQIERSSSLDLARPVS